MKIQYGFIMTDDDADEVTPEYAEKLWKKACEDFEEHRAEIEESERELAAGGGVLLEDVLRDLK